MHVKYFRNKNHFGKTKTQGINVSVPAKVKLVEEQRNPTESIKGDLKPGITRHQHLLDTQLSVTFSYPALNFDLEPLQNLHLKRSLGGALNSTSRTVEIGEVKRSFPFSFGAFCVGLLCIF